MQILQNYSSQQKWKFQQENVRTLDGSPNLVHTTIDDSVVVIELLKLRKFAKHAARSSMFIYYVYGTYIECESILTDSIPV